MKSGINKMIREDSSLKSVYRFLGDGAIFTPFGKEVLNAFRIDGAKYKYRYAGHESQNLKTGLSYMKARWMDPEIGRFISPDPAKDGLNWYVYCSNNPTTMVDPTGLLDENGDPNCPEDYEGLAEDVANLPTYPPYSPLTDNDYDGDGVVGDLGDSIIEWKIDHGVYDKVAAWNDLINSQPYKIEENKETAARHASYIETWGHLPDEWRTPGEMPYLTSMLSEKYGIDETVLGVYLGLSSTLGYDISRDALVGFGKKEYGYTEEYDKPLVINTSYSDTKKGNGLSDFIFSKYKMFEDKPGAAKEAGWEDAIYILGLSLSGAFADISGNFDIGYFFDPIENNLGYELAYADLIQSLTQLAIPQTSGNALVNASIALAYLIKNAESFGLYAGGCAGGQIPPVYADNISKILNMSKGSDLIKTMISGSAAVEMGIYRSFEDMKGPFLQVGGSTTILGYFIPELKFLSIGANTIINSQKETIGLTFEIGIGTPTRFEFHGRVGGTGTYDLKKYF